MGLNTNGRSLQSEQYIVRPAEGGKRGQKTQSSARQGGIKGAQGSQHEVITTSHQHRNTISQIRIAETQNPTPSIIPSRHTASEAT
jgi:hypothetical protein